MRLVGTNPLLASWTNLTVSLDEIPTANALMLKVLDQVYVESRFDKRRLQRLLEEPPNVTRKMRLRLLTYRLRSHPKGHELSQV
jgi:hypothetical protein